MVFFKSINFLNISFHSFRHLVLKVHSQSLLWTWRELTLMMPSQEIFYFQHPYKTWIYYFCFKWFLKTKIFIVNYFWLKIGDWILLHIWTCQNKNIGDLSWNIIVNHVEIHDAVIPYEKGATFLWYLEELVKTFYLLK